jgi:hypothetical protein
MAQEKPVVKKLKCGGWAIYTIDPKTKAQLQTGYVGPNLEPKAYLPADAVIQDK